MNTIVLDHSVSRSGKLLLLCTDVQYGLSFQQSLCAGLIIFSNDWRIANTNVTELAFMPLEQNQDHVINYFHTFMRRSCNLLGYDAMSIGLFRGFHFVHLHVLCILRLHVPGELKLHEQYSENLQIHVGIWTIPLLNTGPLYLHVLNNVCTVRFLHVNCLLSKPTINAPIVHITLHYVLLRVSAHVSAIFRESRLTLRFSAHHLAVNTCPDVLVKYVLLTGAIFFIISDLREI